MMTGMASSALVGEAKIHLQQVLEHPITCLNEKLLESVDGQVTEAIDESDRDALLNQLSALLPMLQQDPTPVTNLINRLISPERCDFSRVLSINPPVDFLAGLTAPSSPVNITTLCILGKAKSRMSDIGIVAGKPDVVGALIRLWLGSQDTAVAERAHDVILGLLLAEANLQGSTGLVESGLMWRRLFRDRDIYGSIFSICSLSTAGQDGQLSKRAKTVAQARLFDMLLRIDSEPVRTSQIPEIERHYGVNNGGLLYFAAIHMVNYRDDVLMHVNLLDFYTMYLSTKYKMLPDHPIMGPGQLSTFALDFLRKHHLHDRSLSYYLNPDSQDPVELTFLYGRSANYLSTWCSTYPADFLSQPTTVESIVNRLLHVLQNLSLGHWARARAPKDDLHVLASLPRTVLLSSQTMSIALIHVPTKPANVDAFKTLAYVFNGNQHVNSNMVDIENAAARALYYVYMEKSQNFWHEVVSAADTVALKEVALAALSLVAAIITARWAPLPITEPPASLWALPTEAKLTEKCHATSLPASGIEAIMTEPAVGIVIPYLLKPAQTFSNLVGGGRGDVESAAYKVAVAKHDTLVLLYKRLEGWVGDHPEAQEMMATVGRRVAQGPMGGTREIVGRVGTLEL